MTLEAVGFSNSIPRRERGSIEDVHVQCIAKRGGPDRARVVILPCVHGSDQVDLELRRRTDREITKNGEGANLAGQAARPSWRYD
jgi:hypothetical protein